MGATTREGALREGALTDLRRIPGVGPNIAADLWDLGIVSVTELRGQHADDLYTRLCILRGAHQDRCLLYVFRCAVYFADTERPDPERLKWWRWKDAPERPLAPSSTRSANTLETGLKVTQRGWIGLQAAGLCA
nr:hypothetical protein [Ktedonobacterales bacterium]